MAGTLPGGGGGSLTVARVKFVVHEDGTTEAIGRVQAKLKSTKGIFRIVARLDEKAFRAASKTLKPVKVKAILEIDRKAFRAAVKTLGPVRVKAILDVDESALSRVKRKAAAAARETSSSRDLARVAPSAVVRQGPGTDVALVSDEANLHRYFNYLQEVTDRFHDARAAGLRNLQPDVVDAEVVDGGRVEEQDRRHEGSLSRQRGLYQRLLRDHRLALAEEAKRNSAFLSSANRPQRGAATRAAAAFPVKYTVTADTSQARRKALEIRDDLKRLSADIANPKVKLNSREIDARLLKLYAELKLLNRTTVDPDVRIETEVALAQLAEFRAKATARSSRPIIVLLRVRDNIATVNAKLTALKASADRFNSSLNGRGLRGGIGQLGRLQRILLAVAAVIGPLATSLGNLTAVVGALGDAVRLSAGAFAVLPAAITALVGTYAAVKVGLNGVGDALSAGTKALKANAVETRKTLAELNSVRNAQEAVGDAQYALVGANRAVTDSYKAQTATLADLNSTYDDAIRRIRSASTAAADAQADLNAALVSGDPRAIRDAREALAAANDDLRDASKDASDYGPGGQKRAEAQASAQDAVTDALHNQVLANRAVRDSQEALVDAQNASTEATKKGTDATDAFRLAYARLSPQAQLFVTQVIALRSAWDDVRRSVQDALFNNTARLLKSLSDSYIEPVRVGLVGIATAVNAMAQEFVKFVTASRNVETFGQTMAFIADALTRFARNGLPYLLEALNNLIIVGASTLPGLVDRFDTLLARFDAFIFKAANDGSLARWINDGFTALSGLIQLFYNLGRIAFIVLNAMDSDSDGFLAGMNAGLSNFADSIQRGTPAFDTLRTFFTNLKTAADAAFTDAFWSNVGTILLQFSASLVTIAPHVDQFLTSLTNLLVTLNGTGAYSTVVDGLLDGFSAFFAVLDDPAVSDALSSIAGSLAAVFTAAGPALGALVKAFAPVVAAAIQLVAGLLVSLLDYITTHPDVVRNLVVAFYAVLTALQVLAPFISFGIGLFIAFFSVVSSVITVITTVAAFIGEAGLAAAFAGVIAAAAEFLPIILAVGAAVLAVAGIILGMGAAIYYAYQNSETFRQTVSYAIGILIDFYNIVKNYVVNSFNVLVQLVRDNKDELVAFGQFIGTVLIGVLIALAGVLTATLLAAIFLVVYGITILIETFAAIGQMVQGVTDIVGGIADGDWKRVWAGMYDTVAGFINLMLPLISGLGDAINTIFAATGSSFRIPDLKLPTARELGLTDAPSLAGNTTRRGTGGSFGSDGRRGASGSFGGSGSSSDLLKQLNGLKDQANGFKLPTVPTFAFPTDDPALTDLTNALGDAPSLDALLKQYDGTATGTAASAPVPTFNMDPAQLDIQQQQLATQRQQTDLQQRLNEQLANGTSTTSIYAPTTVPPTTTQRLTNADITKALNAGNLNPSDFAKLIGQVVATNNPAARDYLAGTREGF